MTVNQIAPKTGSGGTHLGDCLIGSWDCNFSCFIFIKYRSNSVFVPNSYLQSSWQLSLELINYKVKLTCCLLFLKHFIFFTFADPDDTEFENGFGMWYNSNNDKLNWQRHQGYTKTVETGPNADHTLGKFVLSTIICENILSWFLPCFTYNYCLLLLFIVLFAISCTKQKHLII